MEYEEYREDPICKLSYYNYKFEARIGPDSKPLTFHLSVFDTGAGPNIIRADFLPPEVLSSLNTERTIANLASATKHALDTLGIAYLYVDIVGYKLSLIHI